MNETPAATPRVHAGCGHLCLTCGAKAVLTRWRWRRRDRTCTHPLFCTHCSLCGVPQRRWRRMVPLAGGVMVFLVLQFWLNPPKDRVAVEPLPLAGQSLSYAGETITPRTYSNSFAYVETTLNADGGMLTTYTMAADEMGVARMAVSPAKTCMCSHGFYCAVSSGRVTVVGAEPGSVIHVGCW